MPNLCMICFEVANRFSGQVTQKLSLELLRELGRFHLALTKSYGRPYSSLINLQISVRASKTDTSNVKHLEDSPRKIKAKVKYLSLSEFM